MTLPVSFDRNFSSGLRRVEGAVPPEGAPPDAGFNEQGDFEVPNVYITERLDPINSAEVGEYSAGNKFIAGLSGAVGVGPGAIILWPLISPSAPPLSLVDELYFGARLTIYPDDLTPGWVPCAGQVYEYADGTKFRVPIISAFTTGGSDAEYSNSVGYRAGYVMKIPPNPLNDPLRRNFLINLLPSGNLFTLI